VAWALVQDYISRNAVHGARILDFGSHTGWLMQRLGPSYARTGVEVNPRAAHIARERTGADVAGSLGELPKDGRFDVVTAVDVVEHFRDPDEVMGSLIDVLAPGASLVVPTGGQRALAPQGRRRAACARSCRSGASPSHTGVSLAISRGYRSPVERNQCRRNSFLFNMLVYLRSLSEHIGRLPPGNA